jgi:hypothetical protein
VAFDTGGEAWSRVDNVRIPPPLPIHNQPESATESLKLWLADGCCYGRIGKPQQRTLRAPLPSFIAGRETPGVIFMYATEGVQARECGTTVQGN